MNNVICNGTELELSKCRFDGWGINDCESSEAAGVVCKGTDEIEIEDIKEPLKKKKFNLHKHKEFEVRLAGGRTDNEGRVEVSLYSLKFYQLYRFIFFYIDSFR